MFDAFQQAKEMAYRFYDDPNWSQLAWAPHLAQDERSVMGPGPWPNGLDKNRNRREC